MTRHLRAAVLVGLLLAAYFALTGPVRAEEANDSSKTDGSQLPHLSGFVDVRCVHSNDTQSATEFMIGQAEIDLDQHIANRVDYFLAICYNNESGAFELGAAELHLSLQTMPRRHLTKAELVAGRFDVPFGIDYRYVASPDCELVCSPWFTHDVGNWNAWNDLGVRFDGANRWSELSLYLVNGYEESDEIARSVLNLATGYTEDSLVELNSTPQAALGGRLGLLPAGDILEVGLSGASGFDDRGASTMRLLCGDVTLSVSRWRMQAELIYTTLSKDALSTISRGCYLQLRHSFKPFRLIGRCAAVRADRDSWSYQFSGGTAIPLSAGTELRAEIVRTPSNRVISLFEIVAGF